VVEVPVRIYTPVEADSYGLLVYFHGSAFFSGSLNTHDHVARSLAKETGHKVISVGYRLAPEAAYPAGLQDCYGVVRWAAENGRANGEGLRWVGKTLAIAGDSSGATFVAAVAALAHDDGFDRITQQILFYPSLDLDFDVDRYPSCGRTPKGTASRRPRCCRSTPSTSTAVRTRRIRSCLRSSGRTSVAWRERGRGRC
jgi:acetyl esterase